jgi:N-acetylneuraminate synthase
LIAIAWRDGGTMWLGEKEIGEGCPAFLIAEIGNNHNGDIALAKRLVDLAAEAGANCAKFQMRDFAALYSDSKARKASDLGAEYTDDLLRKFQLTPDQMFEVLDYTRECGLVPLCTPWEETSLSRLDAYGLACFKIASADMTNHALLTAAAATGKPLIVSTGMSFEHEIKESVSLLRSKGAEFALLHCNSTYPAPFQDVNLSYLSRLKEISGGIVGYSGHERGFEVCLAAIAMGAKIIEKHFTIDRTMEGNDHRVSLLPDEFAKMVAAVRNVEEAIGLNETRQLTQGERLNREVLAKSLVAKRTLKAGHLLTRGDIDIKSPGQGLQPSRLEELMGVKICRNMSSGEPFFETDIEGLAVAPRNYTFDRPWGIPVRYHDLETLIDAAPVDFVEVHLSYRDLQLDIKEHILRVFEIGFAVHSPELFSNDHIMDLASLDNAYRERSIVELQRVIAQTRALKSHFPKTACPMIVINAGGFSADAFLPDEHRPALYSRVADALLAVDAEGVEIIIQTMPPFPWHFGGQRFHNLFVRPQEIRDFCEAHGFRVCYDVSHSKLACNFLNESLQVFTELVGPYTAHLHIVDARGIRDEGLQVGEGEIDFVALGRSLATNCPTASFIPEIWQGHKNAGKGFWLALDRLEKMLAR